LNIIGQKYCVHRLILNGDHERILSGLKRNNTQKKPLKRFPNIFFFDLIIGNLKVKDIIGRDEGLSRSMVYPKHKVMLFALIDFHRF
jgi:hypothetical protein